HGRRRHGGLRGGRRAGRRALGAPRPGHPRLRHAALHRRTGAHPGPARGARDDDGHTPRLRAHLPADGPRALVLLSAELLFTWAGGLPRKATPVAQWTPVALVGLRPAVQRHGRRHPSGWGLAPFGVFRPPRAAMEDGKSVV